MTETIAASGCAPIRGPEEASVAEQRSLQNLTDAQLVLQLETARERRIHAQRRANALERHERLLTLEKVRRGL